MNKTIYDSIYPLTVISDRYNGVYSGGKYLAFNIDSYNVSEYIHGDDISCMEYWAECDINVGKGETPYDAIADLYIQLYEKKN